MEQLEKKQYSIKNNVDFLKWYNERQQEGYYLLLDLEEMQGLVNKIVAWYELKYPNELGNHDKLVKRYNFDKLKRILTRKELRTLGCYYRWNCGFLDCSEEYYLCFALAKRDNSWERATIYADALGKVDFGNIRGLEHVLQKKKTTTLVDIYQEIQEKQIFDFDTRELEECFQVHKVDLEFRNQVIIFSMISILYSGSNNLNKAFFRAQRLLEEFDEYYELHLKKDELMKYMLHLALQISASSEQGLNISESGLSEDKKGKLRLFKNGKVLRKHSL